MKYKLIKEYPGSPELGYILSPSEKASASDVCQCGSKVYKPSKFPEFWERMPSITWHVNTSQNYLIFESEEIKEQSYNSIKPFKTKELAEAYVELHKPSISKAEILEILGDYEGVTVEYLKDELNIKY